MKCFKYKNQQNVEQRHEVSKCYWKNDTSSLAQCMAATNLQFGKKKKKNSICKAQQLSEYKITMMFTVNMSQFCQLYFNKAETFFKCLSKYDKYFTAKCYKDLKLQ